MAIIRDGGNTRSDDMTHQEKLTYHCVKVAPSPPMPQGRDAFWVRIVLSQLRDENKLDYNEYVNLVRTL